MAMHWKNKAQGAVNMRNGQNWTAVELHHALFINYFHPIVPLV